jgi:signal transduction histidine kinase/ActR/RegA family two-component response regulator
MSFQLATKKLTLHLFINLLLIGCTLICGTIIINSNSVNTVNSGNYLADLVLLKDGYNQVRTGYSNIIDNYNDAMIDEFNIANDQLRANQKFLGDFKKENPEFKNDINELENSFVLNDAFYKQNIELAKDSLYKASLTTLDLSDLNQTEILLTKLITQQAEKIKSHTEDTGISGSNLGYLIALASSLSLILIVVFYYQAKSTLKKQQVHDREIEHAKYTAQVANNAKSEYLAMISHEIRTPMNGVLGMSNLLLQSNLNQEQKDYTNTIHQSAESLLKIVNDVLDFSKIEAGKLNLDQTSVNIKTVIQDVLAILPKPSNNVKITYKINENVPTYINSDPVRLRQILLNLVGNAIKFTEQGTIELECTLIDKLPNDDIRIGFVVRDTGIGIPEHKIKQLFKPFVQVDESTVRKYGGTGLGLNIAYNLITMMNGKIKVQSEINKGSVFTFYITTQAGIEDKKTTPNLKTDTITLDNELANNYPFKILVVDDNEINLMLISKTLLKLGYECKKATNGQLALDLVKEEHFDLIFMDMQMPIMDGTIASTEIRKHYRIYEYPVIIALTANALGDGRDKCLEAGMQDFIAKPFKPAEIEQIIIKWAPKISEYRQKNHSGTFVR